MRKSMVLAGCVLLGMALARPAQAGVFNTAGILNPGHFALGLEPAITFSPSDLELFLHGGLGLTRTIDLDVKLGLGSYTYFGADVEFGLVGDTRHGPGLSFAAGAHGTSHLGLDATLLLSNRFRTFSLFCALDGDVEFHGDDISFPLFFCLGVAIPVASRMDFQFEGDIGVTDEAADALSGGLVFYF
jgi:hypothetical protein